MARQQFSSVGQQRWRVGAIVAAVAMVGASTVVPSIAATADGPTRFDNTATISVPALGSPNQAGVASPYPSTVTVSGLTGDISGVSLTLHDVTHAYLGDIDAMLVAPSGENLVFLSDAGETSQLITASNVEMRFSDSATQQVSSQSVVSSGTFLPMNESGPVLVPDNFAPPAPAPSVHTSFSSAFGGGSPNGNWSLYVMDDATGDVGEIGGGWSLTVTTEDPVASQTTLFASQTPSVVGNAVTFTAMVTSGVGPVTDGSVALSYGGVPLGTMALNGSGAVSLTSDGIPVGSHEIEASYLGATGFLPSSRSLTHVVMPRLLAGDQYEVAEGEPLTLGGSGSGPDIGWDINGDGDYSDAIGATPTLAWADLESLGVSDGPATHPVTARISQNGLTFDAGALLSIVNSAPSVTVGSAASAVVGTPISVTLRADDPSSVDRAAIFDYAIDWGDGSDLEVITGPANMQATHTYSHHGAVNVRATATDKDGGMSEPGTGTIDVATAPPADPSPTDPVSPPSPQPTVRPQAPDHGLVTAAPRPATYVSKQPHTLASTGADPSSFIGTAVLLLGSGAALFVARRRRRRQG